MFKYEVYRWKKFNKFTRASTLKSHSTANTNQTIINQVPGLVCFESRN